MDLEKIKEKAKTLKNNAVEKIDNVIGNQAKKLQESSFVIDKTSELEDFIKLSKNTKNKETGKEVRKRVIVIFAEKDSDFYKGALFMLPILYTKTWTQNVQLKMSSIPLKKLKEYKIKETPILAVFENQKLYKKIKGQEKIEKVVKNLNLNINDTIESL
ncbi:hypothetical protein CSA08_01645 [Candidatus Gracilibacteria bacterium]|nr:MAG: hypothetical protein CSA08_01645 [Candidatus Gracilibacteria bacterium]